MNMKKHPSLKYCSLIVFLALALILVGMDLVQAREKSANSKRPKPPPEPSYLWSVEFPNSTESNFYGYQKFVNSSTVTVSVNKGTSRQNGLYYSFKVTVYNSHLEKLHFQNVYFDSNTVIIDDGTPCGFPTLCLPPSDPDPPYPNCIECFLNDQPHPSNGYEKIFVLFTIFYDIESMPNGSEFTFSDINSAVHISIPESSPFHGVFARDSVNDLKICRSGDGNAWTLDVSQILTFREDYIEWKNKNKKRGSIFVPVSVDTVDEFKFRSIWTRTQVQ